MPSCGGWLSRIVSPLPHTPPLAIPPMGFMCAASGWEIATKVRLGKLPAARELLDDLPGLLAAQGFQLLPITLQ